MKKMKVEEDANYSDAWHRVPPPSVMVFSWNVTDIADEKRMAAGVDKRREPV